jgi:hypothetical protein
MKRTASAAKVKRSGIRAVDQGTVYDVTGKMRWLTREIESGKQGHITDVLIVTRASNGQIGSFAFGTSHRERAHHMITTVKNRLEPA